MKKVITIIMFIIVFTSCSKQDVKENISNVNKNLLIFETKQEFDSTIAKIEAMGVDDFLSTKSESQFRSFEELSTEVFYSVDPDSFTSQ